ncbi:MAG: YqgE/AlgH family protein [Spirochaetia bacterium]
MKTNRSGSRDHRSRKLFLTLVVIAVAVLLTLWGAGEGGYRIGHPTGSSAAVSPRLPALLVQSLDQPQAGTFLVAARSLRDPNFSRTVVFLIDYDSAGAFGLIIDRPTGHTMAELWPDITGLEAYSVYFGGPVFPHHLLFLFRSDSGTEDTRRVFRGVYLGSDELVLKRILAEGEDEFRVYAGHAGWASGQLDNEIARGDWYILPAERAFIFHQGPSRIWEELIQRVDIQVVNLRK